MIEGLVGSRGSSGSPLLRFRGLSSMTSMAPAVSSRRMRSSVHPHPWMAESISFARVSDSESGTVYAAPLARPGDSLEERLQLGPAEETVAVRRISVRGNLPLAVAIPRGGLRDAKTVRRVADQQVVPEVPHAQPDSGEIRERAAACQRLRRSAIPQPKAPKRRVARNPRSGAWVFLLGR